MSFPNRFEDPEHIEWAKKVKERDGFKCQICGRADRLHSHHINSWDIFVEQRYQISNGICLCPRCHLEYFHKIFSSGKNAKYQFEQFRELFQIFHKIINLKIK